MAEQNDIKNTLRGHSPFGTSLDELADGDLSRGYYSQGFDEGYEEGVPAGAVRHSYQIESERYDPEKGLHDEHGFVRRPWHRSDVERH